MALDIHLVLFADDTCTSMYAAEKHEHCVVSKVQHVHTAVKSCCDHRNIKINERKTQMIYLYRRFRVLQDELLLNWQNIPCVNNVKYFGAIFDSRMTLEMYIRTYSLLKSDHLSAYIKHIPIRVVIRSNDLCLSHMGVCGRCSHLLNYVYHLCNLLFIILFSTLHVSTSAGHLQMFYIYHTIAVLCIHSLFLVPSCH
jgi:hypothetical protein